MVLVSSSFFLITIQCRIVLLKEIPICHQWEGQKNNQGAKCFFLLKQVVLFCLFYGPSGLYHPKWQIYLANSTPTCRIQFFLYTHTQTYTTLLSRILCVACMCVARFWGMHSIICTCKYSGNFFPLSINIHISSISYS